MTDRRTGITPMPLCEHSAGLQTVESGAMKDLGSQQGSLAVRLEPLRLLVAGVLGTCHHAQTAKWDLET